jgi:hypothetical protein
MNFPMLDQNLDSEDFDDDFTQWLVSVRPDKPVAQRKLFTTIEEESYRPKPLPIRKPKFDEYGNEIEDDGYRNPGGGYGRPPSSNPASKSISIRVTPSQHKKFVSLGGSKWIREIIDDAAEQPTN